MNKLAKSAFNFFRIRELLENAYIKKKKIDSTKESADSTIENLKEKHLEKTEVLTTRTELIKNFPKGGTGVELGVNKGDFSAKLLKKTEPEKLILVDPWASERYGEDKKELVMEKFEEEIEAGAVDIRRTYSVEMLESLKNNSLDYVYIDTTHSYEQTLRELKTSHKKVREDGIIAGHDYCQGNIEKFISYGIIKAVHQFCLEYNYEIRYLTLETHGHRSFALKKL